MDISQPIPGGVPHQNLCLPPPAPLPQPKQSPMGHVYHQGGIPITEYLRCREKPIARKTHCEKNPLRERAKKDHGKIGQGSGD
jgi:hypothetical protein